MKPRFRDMCESMSIPVPESYLLVSIPQQALCFAEKSGEPEWYPISTSKAPPSCVEDSFGTPLGLHRVKEKFGDGEPIGTVFKGRRSVGQTFDQLPPEDNICNLITSRILWLEGLEPGRNRGAGIDSYHRYIYFHGTNHEERIGQPFSGGCIEFRNQDIIDLYPRIPLGSLVWIDNQ